MSGTFAYLLGALGGVAAVFVLVPLLKASGAGLTKRTALSVLLALVPAVAAFAIYHRTGSPQLSGPALERSAAGSALPAHAGPGTDVAQGAAAGSMEEAVARLESRAAAGQASDADWTLLAQSYEFLGRGEDAARARQHQATASAGGAAAPLPAAASAPAAVAAGEGTAIGRAEQTAAQLDAAVQRNPKDVAAWFALAQARRVARDFDRANQAYDKALALDPRNADAWADYADSLASTGSRSLAGKPAKAIERALALNPNHVKGLWLAASLSLEQKRYGDALAQWQRLRAALPAGSPDLAIIDANIAEARGLSGASQAPAKAAAAVAIEGSVDVAADLHGKVEAGMTLFIYAKTADGKGPPLAVVRQPVGNWPVRFKLDDSLAMMPGRNISSVEQVLVEARLSRSGNAIAEKGDLLAPGTTLKVGAGRPIKLLISRPVG